MALVRVMERIQLEKDLQHTEVNCTYAVVADETGGKHLQVDTYGSSQRQFPGKKSQSIRFSPEAIGQLKKILANEF